MKQRESIAPEGFDHIKSVELPFADKFMCLNRFNQFELEPSQNLNDSKVLTKSKEKNENSSKMNEKIEKKNNNQKSYLSAIEDRLERNKMGKKRNPGPLEVNHESLASEFLQESEMIGLNKILHQNRHKQRSVERLT